jgi:two-component system, LuxR family, response regulator FixJ
MTERSATVFVVDDDPALRTSLETLLGTAGLQAETFASGREFFDAYAPDRPGCLVLDLRLRAESGMEVLDRLRAEHASLPVIMLTAHGDVPASVHALKHGAIDFLEKPVRPTVLIARIREALDLDRSARETRAAAAEVEERARRLTPRERQIATLLMAGKRSKEIASALGIGVRTVEGYRARMLEKMKVSSAAELTAVLLRANVVLPK